MSVTKILFSFKTTPAYGPLVASYYASKASDPNFKIEFNSSEKPVVLHHQVEVTGINHVLRTIGTIYQKEFHLDNPITASQVDFWLDYCQDNLYTADFKTVSGCFDYLDNYLTLRSFMVGYHLTLADFAVWGALKSNAIFNKQLKGGKMDTKNLTRWYQYMNSLEAVEKALSLLDKAKDTGKDRGDKGNMDIPLPDAHEGQVVTRFPPEPSGYLHIGHAKAALLNDYFARSYKGKLIIRFDDTNPSKEKDEFENSIKEDLQLLGIKGDVVVHTSDHFDKIYQKALEFIKNGDAYVDNTDVDTMRNERFDGIESKNRNNSVKENLRLFEEMHKGTELGQTCCLRAKIDMQDKNKCMRDPVMYRCNLTPHHITGTKWKMYPTYDFACPLVDSYDGVTHALRTIEYRDRNPQYAWFLEKAKVRKVHIWDFSRLSFIYTLLSKRKLTWFVEENLVTGWDDPRFPTVRGIRRRGMTIDALRQYIISQGASQRELSLEWDKIWALNKKVIDPISPRHTALVNDKIVKVNVVGETVKTEIKAVPKHKKNPDLGNKLTTYAQNLYLEQVDAATVELGEEITLMDWGNVIVKDIKKSGDVVTSIDVTLNLDGDFKKTKKKFTWLAQGATADSKLIKTTLLDYDYLITKKKLEEDDDVKDFLTPQTEFRTEALGDSNLRLLKKGDIIQLERKGYYICDKEYTANDSVHLISIPDGRADSVASKAASATTPAAPKAKTQKKEANPWKISMYEVDSIYDGSYNPSSKVGSMYEIDSIYPKDAPKTTKAKEQKAKEEKPKKEGKKEQAAEPAGEASLITKLDIVVGKVLKVERHPDADSLYVETIDVGEPQPRTVVSGLVNFLKPEEIDQKLVVILKNLKPVSMRGIKSFAMVLCASNEDHTKVELLVPPKGSKPGDKIFFKGHAGEPEPELKPKKKVWETVQPDFLTTDDLVATWQGIPFETSKGVVKTGSLKKAHIK
ncbi:hypothetical protein HK103_003355 [Boothiomyces macroporosus]|uniref:Probable glutamate--tRNA ligase, cytoplasmic n=1 Tax=Boothiomyces macroporosus TaxID=261099 RepID=A0AAD5ULS0_9FUNG|nr:hypothetical protein HK103_003355 [Boothiomyces macroporosus]